MEEFVGSIPTRSTKSLNSLDRASARSCDIGVMVCVVTSRFAALCLVPFIHLALCRAKGSGHTANQHERCPSGSLCIPPYHVTEGNGMEEVVGSIPTRSTKFILLKVSSLPVPLMPPCLSMED